MGDPNVWVGPSSFGFDILLPLLDLDHGFDLPAFVREAPAHALRHLPARYPWPELESVPG